MLFLSLILMTIGPFCDICSILVFEVLLHDAKFFKKISIYFAKHFVDWLLAIFKEVESSCAITNNKKSGNVSIEVCYEICIYLYDDMHKGDYADNFSPH